MECLGAFYQRELGSVKNKQILEYGCGQGDFSFWLLQHGATVFGIDISEFNIEQCKKKAETCKIDPATYSFAAMDAHKLTFGDNSFDLAVGNGILHHLDLPLAMAEINRVLKPGAKALFQEPLGENPLLRLYRLVAGIHTSDERPLTREDLDYLITGCGAQARYSGLVTLPVALITSIVLRPYPNNWLLQFATSVEERLNNRHVLDCWNRFAVLVYEKK
jgi:SAM-dependent methyltransferase